MSRLATVADGSSVRCRCDEPGADPYQCEAEPEDCTGYFSELNPFGAGSRPVGGRGGGVVRTCPVCGWKNQPWHVDDGSAEADVHDHVIGVHGSYPVSNSKQ